MTKQEKAGKIVEWLLNNNLAIEWDNIRIANDGSIAIYTKHREIPLEFYVNESSIEDIIKALEVLLK